MTISDIKAAAFSLPEEERRDLVTKLIDSIGIDHHIVTDEEVNRRRAELASGEVEGVTWDEIKSACGRG